MLKSDLPADVARAASIIRQGGLVALPTETVYGLAGNALDTSVVQRIYAAKGRPSDNPLIVHVRSFDDIGQVAQDVPDVARALAEGWWPGPLTVVLPKNPAIPGEVTGGGPTVAVRSPDHPAFQQVLDAAGVPLAAPSANTAGKPSPTTARHVWEDLRGKIDAVLDGGPCRVGVESTVVSLVTDPPRLLRPGGVSLEELWDVLGYVEVDPAVSGDMTSGEAPGSPGMKYRHYAPAAPVTAVTGTPVNALRYLLDRVENNPDVAVVCFDEDLGFLGPLREESDDLVVIPYGSQEDPDALSHGLFEALRTADGSGADYILVRCPESNDGLYRAVRNRILKAAAFQEAVL